MKYLKMKIIKKEIKNKDDPVWIHFRALHLSSSSLDEKRKSICDEQELILV